SPLAIVTMPLATLKAIPFADPENARQKSRYLDFLQAKNLASNPDDIALPTYQGTPIGDDFQTYMGLLRSVRINMEFSGSLCRGLKRSRYQQADLSGDVPILVDYAAPLPTHACR
ncbi:MAG: hypothetical protein WCC57_13190, partial [Paracoccaceae bacterium]